MTLQEFSRDVIPILQLCVSSLGVAVSFFGLVSIVLLYTQMRQTNQWNKLNSKYNWVDISVSSALERKLLDKTMVIGIDLVAGHILTDEDVQKITHDADANQAVKDYLTDIENLCSAVEIGAADGDLAYNVHSVRVAEAWLVFEKFIQDIRRRQKDDDIYRELQKVAAAWRLRKEREDREHLRAKDAQRGVYKKV